MVLIMSRNYAALKHEYLEEMAELTDEEFGRLCRALIRYSRDGAPIEPTGNERFYAKHVMAQEDFYIASYEKKAEKCRESGKKGGLASASKRKQKASDLKRTQANGSECKQLQAISSESKENNNNNNNNINNTPPYNPPSGGETPTKTASCEPKKAKDAEESVDFDRFWSAYPKKVGKQPAQKAWSKLHPDKELTEEILRAEEYQKGCDQWTRDSGQYIPNPATWLNQRRWEDEMPRHYEQTGKVKKFKFNEGKNLRGHETQYSDLIAALEK